MQFRLMSPETRLVWNARATLHPKQASSRGDGRESPSQPDTPRRLEPEGARAAADRLSSGEFVASLTGGRGCAMVLDAQTAELIRCFETPATVVDAVLRFCRMRQAEPETVLAASWPRLEKLVENRLLLADQAVTALSRPRWDIPEFTAMRTVHRPAGGEVVLGRHASGQTAALKVQWRSTGIGDVETEAAALARLEGRCAPRLLASGTIRGGATYLIRSWVDGVSAVVAGASARHEQGGPVGSAGLSLAARIARAYASVHAAGVLHGDIHADNVLIDGRGEVTLIDFALARGLESPLAESAPATRAGVLLSVEPEQAEAMLAGEPSVPNHPAGEQFAVGALLYEVLTGSPYMDFRLDREGLLHQVAAAEPRPFSVLGLTPWPELEAILRRSLSPRPEHRFPNLDALAVALETLLDRSHGEARVPVWESGYISSARQTRLARLAREHRERLARLVEVPEDLGPDVYRGAAGVAYVQLQLAAKRQDPSLLAAAELWLSAAEARSSPTRTRTQTQAPTETLPSGSASPFSSSVGVSVVRALLAQAWADTAARDSAIGAFLDACERSFQERPTIRPAPALETELMAGEAGRLLACSKLLDLLGDAQGPLVELGDRLAGHLTEAWRERPRAASQGEYLGMAHGWAGELYAALRWVRSTGRAPVDEISRRLHELAALAVPRGRGASWPRRRATLTAGWCHGSAGYVYLWTAAAEAGFSRTMSDSCRHLAELAAWDVWEGPEGNGTLCCGMAGRAWALLHHAQNSGRSLWRERARSLAERAAGAPMPETGWSLFKGALPLALLEADLESEVAGSFPFFDWEG